MQKIITFILMLILSIESVPLAWTPVMTVDADKVIAETSTRATGFLYGLSESGVPSEALTNSLKISSVSQKVPDGLQHPTGDVDHVINQLDDCRYIVVYLQDAYSTWYYCHQEIAEMRESGTYNWENYIKESYFPIVEEKVKYLQSTDYADRLVYCIYNEPDNAVWFGNNVDGKAVWDDTGRDNLNKAWKMTYDLVKSLAPEAKIGGPGLCGYDSYNIEYFLSYTKENSCVPEIMIYHELADWTIPVWQEHVDNYRALEEKYGIGELPIIVTEYGAMEDCGNPARMIQYMIKIENSGVWGNVAFWRLANNLNDTASDYNTPNSNWWLYKKYAELESNLLESECSAWKDSAMHDGDWILSYNGLASINDEKDSVKIIASGSKNSRRIKLTDLNKTNLGKRVNVKVECVYFEGLSGVVYSPTVLRQYNTEALNGTLNITIPGTDTESVYFVTVTPEDKTAPTVRNTNIPVRYEFEQGELLGNAYTYHSAYSTSGEWNGMCGGFENEGDGIKIKVNAPTDGLYCFKVIYGNSNDGSDKDGRDFTTAKFTLDGKEQEISFPNTIKSEYTDSYEMLLNLKAGCHEIIFSHGEGTFVLDSAIMSLYEEKAAVEILQGDTDKELLAVAPYDGYFKVFTSSDTKGTVDNAECDFTNGSLVYLRHGLNELSFENKPEVFKLIKTNESFNGEKITAESITLFDGAELKTDKYGISYIDGISSESGKAEFTVNVQKAGAYRVTLNYANNLEGGYHDYNIDLIEAMLTFEVNGESKDIFCRNTQSLYTYKTLTFNVELKEGENIITLSNSGSTLFDGRESFAPRIESFTFAPVNAD
ncbi:MAG: hypothetical protein ACI4GC_01315 [Acutalibacteraceae bacterium]